MVAAARRTESRAVWAGMAAVAEFAARRQERPGGGGCFGAGELAARLTLTWQSAAGQMACAGTVARRLPETFAALAAGLIHPVHVRIIEEETSVLSGKDAAAADERLAAAAQSMTFGQLRSAARRLVLKLDPDAARRRKEQAGKDARVRRFQEGSGNAGMVAREMPAAEVLASWQHVEQRALDLPAAGLPGTLQELRVRAYLDLLEEQDTRAALPGPDPAGPHANGDPGQPQDGPGGTGETTDPGGPGDDPQDGPGRNGGPGGGSGRNGGPGGPGGGAGGGPGSGAGPSLAALITITVPLATVHGQSQTPGEAAGFGLLDPGTAADLVAAAARHPRTRWCLTVLHPDGTAAAHGCAPGPPPRPPAAEQLPAQGGHPRPLRPRPSPAPVPARPPTPAPDRRPQRPVHRAGLLPARRRVRPGPHHPWHHGGPTCPCNLAPPCKR